MFSATPTQDTINTALRSFLLAILPAGVSVIAGQVNRTASPEGDYAVFWPLRRPRLATNLETPKDCRFTASLAPIDANTSSLIVTAIQHGVITLGNELFGVNVVDGTLIQSQSSGAAGGVGTYVVSNSQTISSQTMASGAIQTAQSTEAVYQVDVHGPHSADNAQIITTIMRSEFGVKSMAASGVTPLFADEPRQIPFITAAQQYEDRWVVDLHFQVTPSLLTPQEFADEVKIARVPVDAFYPA